ncbi:hypothetical protein AMJ57_03415 [Parcubacteria bacterium SG8_24]|nr:MAG: hypothetical protein AMJ57_03415 [Parcubacteria bacterium SG8_24]
MKSDQDREFRLPPEARRFVDRCRARGLDVRVSDDGRRIELFSSATGRKLWGISASMFPILGPR